MARFKVRPDIDAATVGVGTLGVKREIVNLPKVLFEGETVEKLATGARRRFNGHGLIVATNVRVLFLCYNLIGPQWVEEITYDELTGVEWSSGTLTLVSPVARNEFKAVPAGSGSALADTVRAFIAAGPAPAPEPGHQ
ncbi:PH domain-containing protein [Streptomyces sp. NPDC004726]